MIDVNVSLALENPDDIFVFEYSGEPEFLEVEYEKPLELEAEYWKIGDEIQVEGRLSTTISLACTRCIKKVSEDIYYEFSEGFVLPEHAEDEDSYTYTEQTLSLDKLVFDAITLEIPQKIVCKEACKGLCQHCGIDLNTKSCNCAEIENESEDEIGENNPFAVLKDLFDENENNQE